MRQEYITIKGARSNNLKNISLKIPKNKIIVITGVSGSGKSTLAYETIYAEAQRRYIESLSSYARQFLKRHKKPEYDLINGLSPAIAIEQKTNINHSRSTVGTASEIYHYLTILYANIGKTISPISNKIVKKNSFKDVEEYVKNIKNGQKLLLCTTIKHDDITQLKSKGFSRILLNNKIISIDDITPNCKDVIYLIIDRFITSNKFDYFTLKESYNTSIEIGHGSSIIIDSNGIILKKFNEQFTLDNILFQEPTKELFNFNNPYGACSHCNGNGDIIDIDIDKVIPDMNLSIIDDAIHPWKSGKMGRWKNKLIAIAKENNLPLEKKYSKLSHTHKSIIWEGTRGFEGINAFFNFLKRKAYKIQYRVMLSRYRGNTICKECNGSRLNTSSEYVMIKSTNINTLINFTLSNLLSFLRNIKLDKDDDVISIKIISELEKRISFLIDLGLGYLTINRKSNSLSGGETQRINIAKSIGSGLIGALYILDEPSIGLHAKDTKKLIKILQSLKSLGNTVIVVEHDKDIIKAADHMIDIGPMAGENGGNLMYNNALSNINSHRSLTIDYLTNKINISQTHKIRKPTKFIKIVKASANNLKNININIPLDVLTVITGVSGSGKTTLIEKVLFPGIKRKLKDYNFKKPQCIDITCDIQQIESIDFINQKSMKTSSKSNPITYVKAFDNIRNLYASQNKAKLYNLKPKDFSFNVKGGRCENCKGQGYVVVEMQFMADISIVCEKCDGNRYIEKILDIEYKNKNIAQLLSTTIEESYLFFKSHNQDKIANQMTPLIDVGLGYLKLGQASNTLSSGEAQRLKLAYFLSSKKTNSILIFDEPTKGLHFNDIKKLIASLQNLMKHNNTIIVIEHNLDFIKTADWIIDLGPNGGEDGGLVMFSGTPQNMIKLPKSHTGQELKKQFILK